MSNRYSDYDKGSSRSTRDDSRTHKTKWEGSSHRRTRSRSRSRSPHSPAPYHSKDDRNYGKDESSSTNLSKDTRYEDKIDLTNEWEDSDSEVPAPPPPPRITKISMGFTKPKEPIKMTLGSSSKPSMSSQKTLVASVFKDDDDDDEPEEMPAEARMRMKNIGRETPTSAGPNSFGKTKQGFCDAKKVFEKNLKQALETNQVERPTGKFPQTIYKIKGP